MRKFVLTLAILLAVYIGGTIFFFNLMNSQSTTSAEEITDPELPVLCIDVEGKKINRMFGNTEEMDFSSIRESIIPMTTEREITLSYRAYGNDIRSISYEVYAPDTGEAIENAKIGDFRDDGDSKSATFSLNEPILMDREYPIKFTVRTSDREIYYYSRVIQRAHLVTSRFVEFVYNFYEMSLNKQASSDLNAYIEPDETIKNSNFANVDIHSSLEMISWGHLDPKLVRKAVPVIREINPETATLTCDYIISADNQNGVEETYHVSEYYRLRYYNSKMMLLNFQRKTIQEFTGNSQVTSTGVNLGISTRDVQYVSDPSSGIVAFVQDDALWEFNSLTSKLSRIFTYHSDKENADERDDNDHYGIRIMSVAENGDISFAVYGYMNKGRYEGRTGVMLCRYSGERTDVQIKAFIPYSGSHEILEKYVDKLSYLNAEGDYFLYLNDNVIKVSPEKGITENVVSGIMPDCFVVSKDHSKIAWMDDMELYSSDSISVMDLETGDIRKVKAASGEYLKALGFINDDFIYGIASSDDIKVNPAGDRIFAMRTVMITSFDGSQVKNYTPGDMWIKDVTIEEGLIELERIKKEGGKYVEATSDDIMNNRQTEDSLITTDAKYTNKKGTVISLVFPKGIKNISPLVSYGKIRDAGDDASVKLPEMESSPSRQYYVYGRGRLDSILSDPAKAVLLADELVGTAIDEKGRYLYERGNTDSKNELINEYIPPVFLSGEIDAEKLADGCGEDQDVVNLSGCTLQQVLYQVSCGNAVAAVKDDGTVTVIVGYDRYNTLLYNFDTGEHYYYGINDSTAMFEKAGNVFVTYLENTKTMRDEG